MMKHLCAFLCALPLVLCAEDDSFDARLTVLEQDVKNAKLYNPPANPQVVHGYNLFLFGDALYWTAREDGLSFAYSTNNPAGVATNNRIKLKDPRFEWDWGFRIGLGYIIPRDDWDLSIQWTHITPTADKHVHAKQGSGLATIWAFPQGPAGASFATESSARWRTYVNVLDIELGKEYFVSHYFSVRPYIDVRTVFLDQHYKVKYLNVVQIGGPAINDFIHMSNDFWGVGPAVGVDMEWGLPWGFNVYGGGTLSLVYGSFDIHIREKTSNGQAPLRSRQSFHNARAITDLSLGLGWDHMFFHDQFHFGIKAGWEQHLYFSQNQLFRFVSIPVADGVVTDQGDLSLEGLTISGRIDF